MVELAGLAIGASRRAKMGSGEPMVEKERGSKAPIEDRWVLDESGFRRVGSEEAGEARSQRVSSTAGGPHPAKSLRQRPLPGTSLLALASLGLAALSLMFLLTGGIVFAPMIGFLLPAAAFVLGVIALVRSRPSGGALPERGFAIIGISVGAGMMLFLVLLIWAVSLWSTP